MGMNPVVIEQFPGLDLRLDPGDSKGAIDLMNVVIEPGRVRTRPGTLLWSAIANSPNFLMQHLRTSPGPQMICADTTKVYAIDQGGGTISSNACTNSPNGGSGVNIGTTALTTFYYSAANIAGAGMARKWSGAAWSTPATIAALNCDVIGLSPTDNRLVVSEAATSKVSFSDAGAPETFTANNFVILTPGDGEIIRSMVVFNNQLFIFKQSKFFVFYGTSSDVAGNPIFNYRTVDTGIGCWPYAPQAACAGRDGVYFMGQDGIYRTTGGPPVKISRQLDPLFTNLNDPLSGYLSRYWTNGGAAFLVNMDLSSNGKTRLLWFGDKLFVSMDMNSASRIFVWDPALDVWTMWGTDYKCMAPMPRSNSSAGDIPTIVLGGGPLLGNTLVKIDPDRTTDWSTVASAYVPLVSYYRLPFETYGAPGQKTIRETILEGIGTPTVRWSRDWGALNTGSAVTLGTGPDFTLLTAGAVGVGRQRQAIRGRAFSMQVGASSGYWALNRVQANVLSNIRQPGMTV